MKLIPFQNWDTKLQNDSHLFIAGPCSAETKEQVITTAKEIEKIEKVKIFRAGIWKPRTSPNSFEGVREKGLKWLQKVKQETNLLTCIEVATPEHIEKCLKTENSVDLFWIGARTVANPFSIQAIADALKGVDIPVLVKNPIVPDLKLWIGAIERLYKSGINKIAAIHRGFYPFEETKYRNIPKWELLINMKTQLPQLQIIGDPSHIAGKTDLIEEVISLFVCMNIDGLMIETHINPAQALSDANQQVTPSELERLLSDLNFADNDEENPFDNSELRHLRMGIDSIDYQMFELLAQRLKIVNKIGKFKINNNLSIFQLDRWREIVKTRLKISKELNLNPELTKKIMQIIHKESIEQQSRIKKEK